MSIKLRALSYTAGIFAAGSVAGLALIQILEMFPPDWVPKIFIGVLIVMVFNFCYTITKAHLEYREKLEEIANQK